MTAYDDHEDWLSKLDRDELLALGLYNPPPHEWVTAEGKVVDVREMDRHHAWNLLKWAERNGVPLGTERQELIEERLGEVSSRDLLSFQLRNGFFRVTHPRWRHR